MILCQISDFGWPGVLLRQGGGRNSTGGRSKFDKGGVELMATSLGKLKRKSIRRPEEVNCAAGVVSGEGKLITRPGKLITRPMRKLIDRPGVVFY